MKKKNRILLFTGGNLGSWALEEIQQGDRLIGVDRGALFLILNHLQPDLALGDFDSVTEEEREIIRRQSVSYSDCDPIMKDQTDTEMAFEWALKQNTEEILLLGALGTRFDHSLANVHLLRRGLEKRIPCRIIDEKNELMIMDRYLEVEKSHYNHVSLLPLSLQVTGITLTGFQYPLNKATLNVGDSLGISNVLVKEVGQIEIDSGLLLVIKSKD
ncbi:thiamine diphosphokinase [Ammoniphilus sp. CFH 90114]|uniref:thiamine diphosphokinase n=1 Tax=Ammoniphilus sp. CFH 90114 TaxID=2493665 RepID=UPI00100E74DF|nr:thiamine diphosphokinase [Ammoniphilus sp. CFH 90114]RXT08780.1 thiamine diphosphokinase [Ammoniphilus sp. CFH 90114]